MASAHIHNTMAITDGCYPFHLESLSNWPARAYVPLNYEARYPYPLLILFHRRGSNEEQVLRIAPRLSRRNYVCLSLPGPHCLGANEHGKPIYDWGDSNTPDDWIEDHVYQAIRQLRKSVHIHSERVYLVGEKEGIVPASRLALRHPQHFAGLVSLNGALPKRSLPSLNIHEAKHLRIFLAEGSEQKLDSPKTLPGDFRVLMTGGLPVQYKTYPTTQRYPHRMYRDLNRWIQRDIDTTFGMPSNLER